MKIVFFSDAHLDGKDDRAIPGLISFLRGLKGKISALYIGGDLFDFWLGDNRLCLIEYRPLLETLRELRDEGTEIFYIEGNHDFYLGKFFIDVLKANVFSRECVKNIDGKRVYIAHGDMADSRDYGYRLFRLLFHNRLVIFLSNILPPSFVWGVARLLSRRSRDNHSKPHPRLSRALRRFAERKFAEGFDAVILGHLHAPELSEVVRDGRSLTYVTLGDWALSHTYLEYENGQFSLKRWLKKESSSRPRA